MAGSGQPDNGVPADIRTDIAHPARVYDFWLGGKDNFAADRAAAEQVMQVMPEILDTVRPTAESRPSSAYFSSRDSRRSARGFPPVWQVGQYCSAESANETSLIVSPQAGHS